MRRSVLCTLPSLLLFLSAPNLHAVGGAWVKGPGGYYFSVGFSSTTGDRERGFQGEERPLYRDTNVFARGTMGISNFNLYNEYGWSSWLTSQVSARYTVIVREADIIERGREDQVINESASGFADLWVGLRARLPVPVEGMAAAFNLDWKIPLGSSTSEIPLGTGAADYEASLAVGVPFTLAEDRNGYLQGAGGYRLRNRAEDEFVWRLQGGLSVISTLGLELTFDGVHSTANFDTVTVLDNSETFNQIVGSQSWLQMTGGITYALNDWTDLQAKYTTTLSGRNTLDAQTIAFGVAWKWEGAEGDNEVDRPLE